jgi:archaellum biogenesis ATPase FlaH
MHEKNIIASIIKNRGSWDKLKGVIDPNKELSPEGVMLWNLAEKFYQTDIKAEYCDVEILKSQIERTVSSNKLVVALAYLLDNLPDISVNNVTRELLELRKHSIGLRLSAKLGMGDSGPDTQALIDSYIRLLGETLDETLDDEIEATVGVPVERLLSTSLSSKNLIKVWPKALNDRLDGGVLRGHHILIFARPEMGKTLVAINMVAGFLSQGLRVLYIANEEPAEDVLLRLGSRLSGMNKYEIRDRPDDAQRLINDRSGGNFTIAPLAPGNFSQIEALAKRYQPDVVVLDQLRNIDARSDNRTQALEANATSARNLGKRCDCVVVSITQAGDSASGKCILSMGDVDGSNTGIPGQCDVMVGVGADDAMVAQNIRTLSFPKNKRGGPLSHEPVTVQIEPLLSKIRNAA